MTKLKNIGAERAALAGLVQYGVEVFFENNHFLDINVFSDDKNQLIYSLIKDLYTGGSETIDLASLVTQSHNAGIYELVCKSQTDQEYLRAIFHFDIDRGNISKQIKHLYSLYVARKAQQLHQRAYKDLESFDVSKGLSDILTITESPLNGLLEEVTEEDKIEKIGASLDDYIEYLENGEIGAPGIVGPWPIYNSIVGSGGLDVGIHLIGARPKQGKSTIGKEFCLHVSRTGIPTLYIDSEMDETDQTNRILSSEANVDITEIITKSYRNSEEKIKRIRQAAAEVKQLPFFHKKVSGRDFDYILNYTKRWLHREVGFTNGQANKHFIVYDYFKLTETNSLKDMQEYQAMGFQFAKLHDFCKIHNTSILSFVQLNRDGITKDTTDVISQSDRLLWNCVSFSLLKRKTSDEMGVDGIQNGNMKLIPLEGRFMTRMDDGDYINLNMDFSKSKVTEISTRSNPKSDQGFEFNSEQ